jgi:hypothetical protein
VQQRLILLHDRDVVGLLARHQPVQVRPHRVQRVEGHHHPGQVHLGQQLAQVVGLVALGVDGDLAEEVAVVAAGAEQVHPGAIGAARPAAGLAVEPDCAQPSSRRGPRLGSGPPRRVVPHVRAWLA